MLGLLKASRNPPYSFGGQKFYGGAPDGESNQKCREARKGERAFKQREQHRDETCRKQRGNKHKKKCSFAVGIWDVFHSENEPDDTEKSVPRIVRTFGINDSNQYGQDRY